MKPRQIPPSIDITYAIESLYKQSNQEIKLLAEQLNALYMKLTQLNSLDPQEQTEKLKNIYINLLNKSSLITNNKIVEEIKVAINEIITGLQTKNEITQEWEDKHILEEQKSSLESDSRKEQDPFYELQEAIIKKEIPTKVNALISDIPLDKDQQETINDFNQYFQKEYKIDEDSHDKLTGSLMELSRLITEIKETNRDDKEKFCSALEQNLKEIQRDDTVKYRMR
jgi:hypothetical protein